MNSLVLRKNSPISSSSSSCISADLISASKAGMIESSFGLWSSLERQLERIRKNEETAKDILGGIACQ